MENEKIHFEQKDELLFLYLKGQATDAERAEARKWINEKPEHRKYFDTLKEFYIAPGINAGVNKHHKTEGWNRIETGYYKEMYKKTIVQNYNRKQKLVRIAISSAAAAIVLALFSGVLVHSYMIKKYALNSIVYNETIVPLGSKSQVTLSDGTKVWLNAGSKLRYPVQFGKTNREVYLEGEGYFDVAHNKSKRFLVKTSGVTIKVFGTQFNVKAYPEENKIYTTLVKGSVAIETNDGSKPATYLKPNETAVFCRTVPERSSPATGKTKQSPEKLNSPTNNVVVSSEKKTELFTSWKDIRWIIEGETLGQLAIHLERRYNVKFSFTSEELKNYKFTGTLTDETFEQVMKIIQISAPIEFKLDHNLVTIKEDKLYKAKYDNMIYKTN